MIDTTHIDKLSYPFPDPPEANAVIKVAPGILWARLALPFQLNHINIFILEDGDGWTVIDTGIDNSASRAAWEALARGPLSGRRVKRIIVTHFHPDHIGLAGWLCDLFDAKLITTQTSYLLCLSLALSPNAQAAEIYRDFYLEHGLDMSFAERVATTGHAYLRMVSPLPPTFIRILAGDEIQIGGRSWQVIVGEGHAPEQAMLWSAADNILLAADQVLPKISPNVSVWATEPEGDPLGHYIRSLTAFHRLPRETLVLPAHQRPFFGLHERSDELVAHHEARCVAIADACATQPRSTAELVPILFPRPLDPHQMGFAFDEALAHVNYMLKRGRLKWAAPEGEVKRVVAA